MGLFTWSRDLLSGSLVAAITLAYGFSFAALLFPGPLAPGAAIGVSMMLFGAGMVGLWISWRTRLPLAVAGPDTPVMTAIAALAAAIVLPRLEAGLSVEAGIAMAASVILLTTVIVGLCLLGLGLARVGSGLRFIPHPVVAGFLAGSGLALSEGAVKLLLQAPLSLDSLQAMVQPQHLPQLAAALFIPVVLLVLRPFWRRFYLLPLLFFLELALIHLAISLELIDAGAGWFLPAPEAGAGGVAPLWSLMPDGTVWRAILTHLPEIAAVALIAATSVLMNVSGIEVLSRRSAQLDRELVDHGIAGVIGGIAGGAHSCLSLSRSVLNREAGARSRASGIFAALVVLACGLFGGGLVSFLPLPLLAGLLLYVGLTLLLDRLVELPPRQTVSDYLLMLLIVAMIAVYGFLEGVVAGIIGACLLFAFSYSRIGIVKHVLNRCERASDVERPLPQKKLLERHGDLIRVVGLRGYIFFGTSNGLLDWVRGIYSAAPGASGPRLLILDFQSVTGMDSSAVVSFLKLAHFCEEQGVELLFSGAPVGVAAVFGGHSEVALAHVHRFDSQEAALEHAEEVVLAWSGETPSVVLAPEGWMLRDSGMPDAITRLMAQMESRTVEAGGVIYRQGEPSDTIELLVSGRVQVLLELPGGGRVRLRSMLEQTVLGEMGFFRDLPRSATVVADQESRLLRVTREAYSRMLTDAPDAVAVLHRMIITTMADRLAFANSEVAALKR